jgi:beta-glucanase (GH16 family)
MKQMKSLILLLQLQHLLVHASWKLTWSDEFHQDALNLSKWKVQHNFTHCYPPDPCSEHQLYLKEAVRVSEGRLTITTARDTVVGPKGQSKPFTSGWIDTKTTFAQQYGKFAANCSLPSSASLGIWPAFWLLPEELCWPTGGEIDIFEFGGNVFEDDIFGSYHYGNVCGKDLYPVPGKGYHPPSKNEHHHKNKTNYKNEHHMNNNKNNVDWQMEWHVYSVIWTTEALTFYVDDVLYFTRQNVTLPPTGMYVILNQAVGGVLSAPKGGTYPSELQVEWVRVFEHVNE